MGHYGLRDGEEYGMHEWEFRVVVLQCPDLEVLRRDVVLCLLMCNVDQLPDLPDGWVSLDVCSGGTFSPDYEIAYPEALGLALGQMVIQVTLDAVELLGVQS